jgi:anti-anti-sigma regulatory factor
MSSSAARLLVMAGKEFACIRVIGKADFTTSLGFQSLVSALQNKGFGYFVIELSECVLMDSTFLGGLAGMGLKLSDHSGCDGKAAVELLNPNARILDLLDTLGILYLFRVNQGAVAGSTEAVAEHTPAPASRIDVTRACLEAHETLMRINPKNIDKFKDVAAFMAEDLKRMTRE